MYITKLTKTGSVILLLSALAIILSLSFVLEDPFLKNLMTRLDVYTADFPQEKVHLHTDKPYYAIGEDIWFKGYVVIASNNGPSGISRVLYVDLVDDKNNLKKSKAFSIDEGIAYGSINLTDSITAGTYRLRAYTKYMLNYDHDFIFEKQIEIGDVTKDKKIKKESINIKDIAVQFFPEGGSLVTGLRSKVGIKALLPNGLGTEITGHVVNRAGEEVMSFKTEHAGMGVMALVPERAETYKAVIDLPNGGTKTFNLPEPIAKGYVLSVNGVDQSINISINNTMTAKKRVFLVAQSNGVIYTSFEVDSSRNNVSVNIPESTFPTGIVQFSLIDETQHTIAERLYFANNNDQLRINIKQLTPQISPKSKAEFQVAVSDENNKPVSGNFSVSVVDFDKVPFEENREISILSNLLLTSDLKGYIEEPNYYFSTKSPEKKKQLDYLLITQGWSRFVWKDVTGQHFPVIKYLPEQGMEISGRVTTLSNKGMPMAKMLLYSRGSAFNMMLDTLTNKDGYFMFDHFDIIDTASIIVQAKRDKKSGNLTVYIDPVVRAKTTNRFPGNQNDITPYLKKSHEWVVEQKLKDDGLKGINLKTVEIKASGILESKIKNSANIGGQANYTYDAKFLEQYTSFFSAVGRMSGVYIKDGLVRSTRSGLLNVIVDGMPIDQKQNDFLNYLNPNDVEGVELLITPSYTIIYGGSPVLMITMKRGSSAPRAAATNISVLKDRGFALTKEFYVPDYTNSDVNKELSDLRSTIYWNPLLLTSDKGMAPFSFFTSGASGNHRIIVEGIGVNGRFGRQVFDYKVNY